MTPSDAQSPPSNFSQYLGYSLTDWSEGSATVSLTILECHRNNTGIMHGGVLASIIDSACGYAIIHNPDPEKKRRAVTLSLTTQFTAAGKVGDQIMAKATLKGGGKRIKFLSCEVHNQDGLLIGQGEAVMKMLS